MWIPDSQLNGSREENVWELHFLKIQHCTVDLTCHHEMGLPAPRVWAELARWLPTSFRVHDLEAGVLSTELD